MSQAPTTVFSVADPLSYRPAPGEIPTDPGVYRFCDSDGRVIYVGKAKNLRSRLGSYFQDLSALHPRTQSMVTTAACVQWTVVATEVEALALEYSWIKQFDPRFNVKYRDDKSYPYLAVTMGEQFPRAQVMRGAKRPGTRYFGPYGHAWAIRDTLDTLLRVFPIRTCSAGVFKRSGQTGRPCLLGYIDKCSAPCVGRISDEDHRQLAADFCDFMAGDTSRFIRQLSTQMGQAAAQMEYERAARLRDDIAALERSVEKNAVVLGDATDADIFGLAGDDLEAAVQVFHVRGGRIRGQRGWVVEKVEPVTDAQLITQLLLQVYGQEAQTSRPGSSPSPNSPSRASLPAGQSQPQGQGQDHGQSQDQASAVPPEILVPVLPEDRVELTAWLSGLRGGRKVTVKVAQRGDKRQLSETVTKNAEHALALHRTRRAGDLTTRSLALRELQEALDLDTAPLRIECYDISHTAGTYQSASMVVFEDGLARKSEYRTFSVRGPEGLGARDDTAAMYEVLSRRFTRYLRDREGDQGIEMDVHDMSGEIDAVADQPRRFAYPPHLVVVDGGQPQVAAAQQALDDLGITDVALCGLAKRLEEVWLPGQDYPVVLQRASQGLYLLQRLRDEAHRFAISAHRKKRSKGMTASALDQIPGLGPARQKELLRCFGSVKAVRAASIEEIASVPGLGPNLAAVVYEALNPPAQQTQPAVQQTQPPASKPSENESRDQP